MEGVKQPTHHALQTPKPTLNGNNTLNNTPTAAVATGGDGVRRVGLNEYKQAAQCLAEAFAHDDVARYFTEVPDGAHWTEDQKWNLHVSILEYITYAHILNGLVLTSGSDYGCVALW